MLESYWGCLERPGGELEKIGENYQLSKHLNFFGWGVGGGELNVKSNWLRPGWDNVRPMAYGVVEGLNTS